MFAARGSQVHRPTETKAKADQDHKDGGFNRTVPDILLRQDRNSPGGTDSLESRTTLSDDSTDDRGTPDFNAGAIDEDSIYSKNEHTLVAYFGPLPREVDEALDKTDFYTQPMHAKIDLDAGFGIVVSQKKCYIWAVQKNTTYRSPPVCFTLPMPPNNLNSIETSMLLPVVIITMSDDQYPGVLACSPDGTCWYWNNIDMCFANVDHHVDTKIDIAQDDYVSHVECAGPLGYFFGTRYANVYQVSIKKQYGTAALASTQLRGKSGGAIASIFSMVGMAPALDTTQKIASMTSGPVLQDQHGRWELFTMTRRSLFKWNIHRSGECTFESEISLKEKVTERILADFSANMPFGSDPRVRLLDIEYIKNGRLLVLATFFDIGIRTAATPLSCALFTLATQYDGTLDIEHVRYIQRKIEEDLRPEASPKLVVPQGGPAMFIIMPMAVIISSTLPSTDFEDLVPLKSDRIIGFGREDWKLRGQEMGDASELSIVCKSSGRLGIHIQLDGTACSALTSAASGRGQLTAMLQAKLEQAVFFSGKKHNPISFDLAHYDGGDLNTASLNVSKEILNSHAALLSSGKDMTTRLSERYQRIKSIISCIQTADMASRLSIESRFQLCWNAEKLAAASALWNQYQSRLAGKERERAPKTNLKQIFHDAASQCLKKIGNHSTEDPISILMKYHVDALAELIYALQLSVGKLHTLPLGQQAELTRDVNKIIILSLRSAWSYRKQNVASYALQSSSSTEPWTASEQIVKALTDQYKRTLAACRANLEQSAGTMDVDDQIGVDALADITFELKDQLCDLADATLQAHSEHLQYLEGLPQSSVHNIAISAAVDTYDEAKVQLLTPLVELKKTQSAVQLAERYKDFITLVKLSVGHEKKISNYIAKYQQEYANALFMWYHDNDQLPTLLEQGDKYSDLFTVFLDNQSICGEIAWLHDIKIKRFAEASERVQENAFLEANIDRRRTMFSLSKLLFLAGLPRTDIDVESSMKFASRNNEELEMATIQTLVADEWEENHVGSLVNLEDKADAVIKSFGSHTLANQPTLREAILQSIRSLLNRQTISSEDLLDVLMLQQTFEIDNFDVSDVALGICLHAADIPESRRLHVLQDIWRRIYIADEDGYWRLEDMSDFEAREKLLGSWMCRAYGVIYRAEGHKDELLLRPEEATCDMPENLFRERFMAGADQADTQRGDEIEKNYRAMIEDYQRENDELQRRIQEGQLLQKWERVKVIIKEIATSTVPESVLLAEEALMEDVEMQESML